MMFNPNIYNVVANNVNKYVKLKNILVKDLAKYTKINEDFLIKFLSKENPVISIYDLYKISVILDVNINEFFK